MKKIVLAISILFSTKLFGSFGCEYGIYSEYTGIIGPFSSPSSWLVGGGELYVNIGKRFTLDYRLGISAFNKSTNSSLLHSSLGFAWGCSNEFEHHNSSYFLYSLIPEGFGFYPAKRNGKLHVAIQLFGSETEIIPHDPLKYYYHLTFGTMIRYKFFSKNKLLAFSPYVGVSSVSILQLAFRVGCNLTFNYEYKKRSQAKTAS